MGGKLESTLRKLISSRSITRYRLGKLIGLDTSNMTPFYESLNGKRGWKIRDLTRVLWTINDIQPLSAAESDQIIRALLEAGNDEQ